jgi:drug/metabolite transporter (DMT)-like permease
MSLIAFAGVLLAALLHAVWNALIKSAGDKLLTTITVALAAAGVAAVALPWVAQPAAASWPFIAASALLTIAYFILVARIYHFAELSQSYPVMRGIAPLLVALVSAGAGERLSLLGWLGVLAVSVGVISVAASPGRMADRKGLYLTLANSVLIASYTLIDGIGVRRAAAPVGYTLWIFLLSGLPLGVWAALARRVEFTQHLAKYWHLGLAGGIGSLTSYGLALWAMTAAPIAMVAALRETSIVFGTLLAWLWLREHVGVRRLGAVCIIAGGAIALRMA